MYNLITPPEQNEDFCKICGEETSELYFNSIDFVCTECLEKKEISECEVCGNPDYSDNMLSDENQEGLICKSCLNSNIRSVNQAFSQINNLFNF